MYRKESYSRIIAISGNTGAGKSTLAKLLAKKLEASIVTWDDYDEFSAEPDDYVKWYQYLLFLMLL